MRGHLVCLAVVLSACSGGVDLDSGIDVAPADAATVDGGDAGGPDGCTPGAVLWCPDGVHYQQCLGDGAVSGTCPVATDAGSDVPDVVVDDVQDAGDVADSVDDAPGDASDGGPPAPACDSTAWMPSAALDSYCVSVATADGFTWDSSYPAGPPRCITRGEPAGPYAPVLTNTSAVCEICGVDATLGYEVCRCFRTPHGPFLSVVPPEPCMPP